MKTPAAYRHKSGAPIETVAGSPDDANDSLIRQVVGSERRTTKRFPLKLPAELCIREMCIRGTTVNISSGGLLMKCSHDSLKIGWRVKVRLTNWPNPSGKKSQVTLIMDGAVVRDSPEYIAVRRIRYEFIED
jgi:PilZ domain